MSDNFFDVPKKDFITSGGPVSLPILYYDTSCFHAFFTVDFEKAEAKLAGTGLAPQKMGKKAMAAVAMYEYRKTSIGAYNEVGLAIVVHRAGEKEPTPFDFRRPAWDRKIGMHILDLPVSTQAACTAGREIWGYPKFVTEMPLTFGDGRFKGKVLMPDSKDVIVILEGTYPWGPKLTGVDLVLFSNLDGKLVKTVVDVDSKMRTTYGRGVKLTVGNGQHRMADNVRALGLDGARAIAVQCTEKFRSRLHGGKVVG